MDDGTAELNLLNGLVILEAQRTAQQVDRSQLSLLEREVLFPAAAVPSPQKKMASPVLVESTAWAHTTCCEIWHGADCCGCCDRGLCYIIQHLLCLPCSFGRMADKGADCSCGLCCCCMVAAAPLAAHTGGPILPCAGIVRRRLVKKYNIDETCCCSVLHVICCPGVSMLQMLMEVEEREMGEVGLWGEWTPKAVIAQPVASGYKPPGMV